MFHRGQNDLNDDSKSKKSLIEAYDCEKKASNSSKNTQFLHPMTMIRRGSTGDMKNGFCGKYGRSDVNNNTTKMESTKRKFSCPEIEAIIDQYVNPNEKKPTNVSLHTGTMRRCRSLNELPGSIRVPIIRRGETNRMKARLEASRAGTEELKKLREKQEKMMAETINCVNVKKMSVPNNKLNQTRRMSGPVWLPDSGLSKITEDVEQTFPNDVFLDKNLRDRTNFDISNVEAEEVPDRRSFSLRNTETAFDSSTKDAEESWTMWTKRAESLIDHFPHKRSTRSHSFSVGSNTIDIRLPSQSVSDSTINSENIEPKLRRASLQGHAVITGIKFEKRGSSVFENMDISSTSPNPLHAVLMQYALSGKSDTTQKIQTKDISVETKCSNDHSHSVIKQTYSAIKDKRAIDAISNCDKMSKEYGRRFSYSKATSYSTSDICQNKTANIEMKNKKFSPGAQKQKVSDVDQRPQRTTIHRPTSDTSCRADNLFISYNQQIHKPITNTNKPTPRRCVNPRSRITDSNEHLERTKETPDSHSEQLSEYDHNSNDDQSIQSTSECTDIKATILSNDNYTKKFATHTPNKEQHNLITDSGKDKRPADETDFKESYFNPDTPAQSVISKDKDVFQPPLDALSLSDDMNTDRGLEKISPINSPNTFDIEMVSEVFSFSSADLINYSSQSPQHQKLTSYASDEGFVTSTPSLESTSSVKALCIGNESYGFHSRSLSIASDEGYSASPPSSPKQNPTTHKTSSKENSNSRRRKSGGKTVSTRSFKQTAV